MHVKFIPASIFLGIALAGPAHAGSIVACEGLEGDITSLTLYEADLTCIAQSEALRARATSEAAAAHEEIQARLAPTGVNGGPARMSTKGDAANGGDWTLWGEVMGLRTDRDATVNFTDFGYDGNVFGALIGADRVIAGGNGIIGGYLKSDRSDFTIFNDDSQLETRGLGFGTYVGYALSERWFVDGLVSYTRNTTDVSYGAVFPNDYSFDGDQLALAGNLTGYYFAGQTWRISPSFGVIAAYEREDEHLDGSGFTVDKNEDGFVSITTGMQVARTIYNAEGRYFEPFGGIAVSYDVSPPENPQVFGLEFEPDRYNLSASLGFTGQLSDQATFGLSSTLGNIGSDTDKTVSANARMSFSF